MLEGALMVQDTRHLTKLIEDLDHIIKGQIYYKRYLKKAASSMQETTKPKHTIALEEELRNLDIPSDKRFAITRALLMVLIQLNYQHFRRMKFYTILKLKLMLFSCKVTLKRCLYKSVVKQGETQNVVKQMWNSAKHAR